MGTLSDWAERAWWLWQTAAPGRACRQPLSLQCCPRDRQQQPTHRQGAHIGLGRSLRTPAGPPGPSSRAVCGLRMVTATLPKWGTGSDEEECAWGQQDRVSEHERGGPCPHPEPSGLLPHSAPGAGAAGQPGDLAVMRPPDRSRTLEPDTSSRRSSL